MPKPLLITIIAIASLIIAFFALNSYIYNEKQAPAGEDPANTAYRIEGESVQLVEGMSEMPAAPDSAEKVITRYFGNEVHTDLDGDGRDDAVLILTQSRGGTGTFYYVVAALNTERGHVGSEALLLGDRIALQTTEVSQDPNHKGVVVVNYADRRDDEPMTAQPSIAKSIWLKLDPQSMQLGEVAQNFEGEADPSVMQLTMKGWVWQYATRRDGEKFVPRNAGAFVLTFADATEGVFSSTTDCNQMGGSYTQSGSTLTLGQMMSTLMFCENSQESDYAAFLSDTAEYQFTSKGELILILKDGLGSMTFR
jgi:heat shock protein HslJ